MRKSSRIGLSRSVIGGMVALMVVTAASLVYAGGVTTAVTTMTVTSPTTMTQTVTSPTTVTSSATVTQTTTNPTTTETTTQTTAVTTATTKTVTAAATSPMVINLVTIPDWGGAGWDAFVIPTSIGSTPPKPADTGPPGPDNNNVTVSAGVPITFVITNVDLSNYTFNSIVSVPFTVFNDTADGYVAVSYVAGQNASMTVSHTFTINSLNLNIPIPPDTVVTFTYTFLTPGVYRFHCMTPCGAGAMNTPGYMAGYVIVK